MSMELLWLGADDVSASSSLSAESDNVICSEAGSLKYTKFFSSTAHEVIRTAGRVSTASPH